jgi:hypothetical protein
MNFTPVLPGATIDLGVSLHFFPLLFSAVFAVFPFKGNTFYPLETGLPVTGLSRLSE